MSLVSLAPAVFAASPETRVSGGSEHLLSFHGPGAPFTIIGDAVYR